MIYWALAIAAVLLSFERIAYYWISHRPTAWLALCSRPPLSRWNHRPTELLRLLFYGFKLLQIAVFIGWCMVFSGELAPLPSAGPAAAALGGLLIAAGLVLNFSVFRVLGNTGVFYGSQFGHAVPWVNGFPFSLLKHPQYIGSLAVIWGFFLLMRYPHPDWILLPLLETLYYGIGARYEP